MKRPCESTSPVTVPDDARTSVARVDGNGLRARARGAHLVPSRSYAATLQSFLAIRLMRQSRRDEEI